MTAIEFLKNDHQEAMTMFDQLENADADQLQTADENTAAVRSIMNTFNKLKNALVRHTQIEEQVFYPALENFDQTRDLISESYAAHQEVEDLLQEMSSLSPTDDEWMDKVMELRESVEHHVDEEENELFPKAEQLLGQSRLQEMGRQMQEMKRGRSATATMKRK